MVPVQIVGRSSSRSERGLPGILMRAGIKKPRSDRGRPV